MDCSLLFASMFSGTCFRNQNQFNEALQSFEVVNTCLLYFPRKQGLSILKRHVNPIAKVQLRKPSSTSSTRSSRVLSMGLVLGVGPGSKIKGVSFHDNSLLDNPPLVVLRSLRRQVQGVL